MRKKEFYCTQINFGENAKVVHAYFLKTVPVTFKRKCLFKQKSEIRFKHKMHNQDAAFTTDINLTCDVETNIMYFHTCTPIQCRWLGLISYSLLVITLYLDCLIHFLFISFSILLLISYENRNNKMSELYAKNSCQILQHYVKSVH